jgi:hypothetical protein
VRHTPNPEGAVTIISAVKSEPPAVKLCAVETTPEQAVNAERVPEVVIVLFKADAYVILAYPDPDLPTIKPPSGFGIVASPAVKVLFASVPT